MADENPTGPDKESWADRTSRSPDDMPGDDTGPTAEEWARSAAKNPDDADPMTQQQTDRLRTLANQLNIEVDQPLSSAEADRVIQDLEKRAGE